MPPEPASRPMPFGVAFTDLGDGRWHVDRPASDAEALDMALLAESLHGLLRAMREAVMAYDEATAEVSGHEIHVLRLRPEESR